MGQPRRVNPWRVIDGEGIMMDLHPQGQKGVLGTVKMETKRWTFTLHDTESRCEVIRSAHQRTIIQIPNIELEARDFRLMSG